MIRKNIFCSVIESPMMASRSPGCSSRPAGAGAFFGSNLAKYASSGFGSNPAACRLAAFNATKMAASKTERWNCGNERFMVVKYELHQEWASRCEALLIAGGPHRSRQPHGPPEFCAERNVVGHVPRRAADSDGGVGSPRDEIRRSLDLIWHAGLALQLEDEFTASRGDGLHFWRGRRAGEKRQ